MSILDLAEFKKTFEKSERYATAAVEVKKLNDAKTLLKSAKTPGARLAEARALQQQIERTHKALKTWEAGLSAPFAALVASKKVHAQIAAEGEAVKKAIAKETRDAEAANVPSVSGLVMAHKVALINLENELDALARYGAVLKAALPSIADGSIPPASILKLETDGKKQLAVAASLKASYLKSRADFSAMAGPSNKLGDDDKKALKGLLVTVGDYLRKVEAVPDIAAALADLKALRKKMVDNQAGLATLLAQASAEGAEVDKQVKALDAVVDTIDGLTAGLQQAYPDPKTTNVAAAKLAERRLALKQLQTTLGFRLRTIAAEITRVGASFDAFARRADKLLGADAFKALAKTDKKIAAAGSAIAKQKKDLTAALAAVRTAAASATTDGGTALTFVDDRLADYVDEVAKGELAKKPVKS